MLSLEPWFPMWDILRARGKSRTVIKPFHISFLKVMFQRENNSQRFIRFLKVAFFIQFNGGKIKRSKCIFNQNYFILFYFIGIFFLILLLLLLLLSYFRIFSQLLELFIIPVLHFYLFFNIRVSYGNLLCIKLFKSIHLKLTVLNSHKLKYN